MKNKRKYWFIGILVSLILIGCGSQKTADESSEALGNSVTAKADSVTVKDNYEKINSLKIESDSSGRLQNNLNNFFGWGNLVYDENYIYFIASKREETSKLCRMKYDGSEFKAMLEVEGAYSLWVSDGFIYYAYDTRIGRINLETFEEEKRLIEIPVPKDIKRKDEVYEARVSVSPPYCIDNKLIYSYHTSYLGTSSNESTDSEMYNLETGETTKFNIDFAMSQFAFDGENLYFYVGLENIRVVSLDEITDGNEDLVYKEVMIRNARELRYIGYNGLIVGQNDGSLVFYSFDDCKKLKDGEVWEYRSVIRDKGDMTSIFAFDNKNIEVLLLSDSLESMFIKNSKQMEIFKNNQLKESSNSLEYLTAYGAVGDRVYFLGYDAEGQLIKLIILQDMRLTLK